MDYSNEKKLNDLMQQVEQHEETIAQLVVIIAETNRRITELKAVQEKSNQQHLVSSNEAIVL